MLCLFYKFLESFVPVQQALSFFARMGNTPLAPLKGGIAWARARIALLVAGLFFSAHLHAATYEARPGEDLRAFMNKLAPGDTLLLRGGSYPLESLRIDKQGAPEKYIVIASAPNEKPVLTAISPQHNLISIRSAAYMVIDGVTIDGTPLNVDAIKFEHGHASHDVIIQNCEIKNFRGVAINSKGEDHHITVRNCHIHHSSGGVGEAFYIGMQDGRVTPHHWLIENNLIHDTAGRQGDGIELKYGVHSSVLRDNVVFNTQYPAILSYGVKGGNEDRSRSNVIEGNVVFDTKEGIGAYADAVVRNNIVFNCKFGYLSRPHRKPPQNLEVYNNTFYGCGTLYFEGWSEERRCLFVNNAAYDIKRGAQLKGTGVFENNLGNITAAGFRFSETEKDLTAPHELNFYPTTNSALRDGASAHPVATFDFNQQERDARPDIGAFEWNREKNFGGPLARTFKVVKRQAATLKQ